MTPSQTFAALLRGQEPSWHLAPMQDVTDLAFWRVIAPYGGADVYWTEYFRVHGDSRLENGFSTRSPKIRQAGPWSRR
jgi:tRNA-dihydrouridine synthase B